MVKIGVIGRGGSLHSAIEHFSTTDGVLLSGVFESGQETESFFSPSIQALSEVSDALYILESAPNPFEVSAQGLRQGKHIFLEQISSLSVDETEQLLKSRKEANVKCLIGSQELCHPAFLAIRNHPVNPLFIKSERSIPYDIMSTENIILDMMIKDITVVLNVVKSDIKRIGANGHRVMSEQTDVANARLEFSNGCVAVFTVDKNASQRRNHLKLYEENKIVSIDFESNTTLVSLPPEKDSSHLNIIQLPLEDKNPFRYQLENFRDSITINANPLLKLREGYEKLDIAHKILKKILSSSEE